MRILFFIFSAIAAVAKPFATCEFRGQLGNQMWEVATTVAYALEHGCEPIFPNLKEAIGGEENHRYIFHRLNTSPIPDGVRFQVFTEAHSHKYVPIPSYENVRLVGHFESPKYFEKYTDEIRDLFAPTSEILNEIEQKYGDLLKEPTVAVHVRTYIPDGRNPNDDIGGASWSYFIKAMEFFPRSIHFLIFSDDIEWTKQNFPRWGRRVTFIEGNPRHIDFYLISLCNHVIVSPESTFSWWAAWLNRNPNKMVIVADKWGFIVDNDTIPTGWVKLPKL